MHRLLALSLLGFSVAACGGTTLTRPTDLPTTTYPANEEFTLSLVMQPCSFSCERYEAATCDVDVDEDARVVSVSPQVEVEREDDEGGCSQHCQGAPVLAHCEVEGLPAGTYTVEADDGGFSRTITVGER